MISAICLPKSSLYHMIKSCSLLPLFSSLQSLLAPSFNMPTIQKPHILVFSSVSNFLQEHIIYTILTPSTLYNISLSSPMSIPHPIFVFIPPILLLYLTSMSSSLYHPFSSSTLRPCPHRYTTHFPLLPFPLSFAIYPPQLSHFSIPSRLHPVSIPVPPSIPTPTPNPYLPLLYQ